MPYNLKSILSWSSSVTSATQVQTVAEFTATAAEDSAASTAELCGEDCPTERCSPARDDREGAEDEESQGSVKERQLSAGKFKMDGARQLRKPGTTCAVCDVEVEVPGMRSKILRHMDTLRLQPASLRTGLDRLWSSNALSKCFLCTRTLCSKHCEVFPLPYGVLPEQMGQPCVCQDCLPEAKTLRDMELQAIHTRRLEQAACCRAESVKNGGGCWQPEQSRQCIECPAKADMHCPICGLGVCSKHTVSYPTSCGSRAPKRLKACAHCEEVALARAEARIAVRGALAEAFRGSLRVKHLGFAVAVAEGMVPTIEEADDCAVCGLVFSKMPGSLRHHCHICGLSLCSGCLCGKAGCLGQGPMCPHRARLPSWGITKEERVCHKCLPTTKVRLAANAACDSICSTALKNATHCWRVEEFLQDPAVFPLYKQRYVDTAKHKALRAGTFAVEGARQAAPFLSMPWAVGVRAADLVWNYGQYGLVGILCSGEIMDGLKTLMHLSSSLQSIQPRDLLVGMIYLSADQRRQLRDDPEGAKTLAAASGGQPLPADVLDACINLAVLGMHGPYETDPFEAQRYALQQHWRLVTERLGESWKHQPSWCLYVRTDDSIAAIGIRGTDLEQSCGGDLFTDVNAVPVRTEGVNGKVMISHAGMLSSAKALESELRPTLRALVAGGYHIAISGHSLGAAVAGLLVWLLHWGADGERLPEGSSIFGIGYACPSAVDKQASLDLQPYFTSVVNPMDVVPRLSTGTLRRLGTDIVACARQSASDLDEDVSHFVDRLTTLWAPRMRDGVPLPIAPAKAAEAGAAAASAAQDSDVPHHVNSGHSMGFEVILNSDPFPGSDHHSMPSKDLDACKRTCVEMNCGAFVVWRGYAYFRAQSVQECRSHLVRSHGSVTYLNLQATQGTIVSSEAEDLYVPGNVAWIHRVNGHLEASVVPCDFPPLRRITLDKRMFVDHSRLAYHTALHAVKVRNNMAPTTPQVRWQRFADAGERCPCCGSVYEWMNTARSAKQRWHAMTNCRSCGLVVCLGCATTRKALPDQGILEPARVCDRCVWRGPDKGAVLATMPQAFQRLAAAASDQSTRT